MNKKLFKKGSFILLFLIIVVIASYTELYKNLKVIRKEKEEYPVKENQEVLLELDETVVDSPDEEVDSLIVNDEVKIPEWRVVNNNDNSNNQLNLYSSDNVTINEDEILIISRKENMEDKEYTSGLVESNNSFRYGYFQFDIEFSEGKGLFPAIWLLPESDAALPEIDIFEMIGSRPYTFYGVIHFMHDKYQKSDFFEHDVIKKEKYTVALKWHSDSLTWFIDGKEKYKATEGVPQEYMFIIINQAIGGNWPGDPNEQTIFPNEFRVRISKIEPLLKRSRI